MKNIVKSPLLLKKEQEIERLCAEIKKRETVLKSLKTRLNNTSADMEDLQRSAMMKMSDIMVKVGKLLVEIQQTISLLLDQGKITQKDKEMIAQILSYTVPLDDDEIEQIQKFNTDEMSSEELKDYLEQELGEKAEAQTDYLAPFRPEADPSEQRDIRKIYISLSSLFHPDKAQTEQEAEYFHGLMQKINEAYKALDIHTLLEIEATHSLALKPTLDTNNADALDSEIGRLSRNLAFIEGQITRTSETIANMRNSMSGDLLAEKKRAAKAGIELTDLLEEGSPFDFQTLEQVKNILNEIQESKKKITKKQRKFLDETLSQMVFFDMLGDYMDFN